MSSDITITFEESCNRFLKTRKGLQYLLLKFRNLSFQNAIREYKYREAETLMYT